MRMVGRGLSRLGRHGPVLLVLSLAVGAASPTIAAAARELLLVSAFLLAVGSFLSAALAPPQAELGWRRLATALAWVGIGVPALVGGLVAVLRPGPGLEAGILLSVVAPPVGSAAALAAMFGLLPRLALVLSVALTLAAPLLLPALAAALGLGASIDMRSLALRLALVIGTAALIAHLARNHRRHVEAILPDQQAAAGVAVVGLAIVGLAMANGLRVHGTADPDGFGRLVAIAVAINLGAGLAGTMLFLAWGGKAAFTVGLVSGNRNVTMAWAAAGSSLPLATEAYVAACVLPVLTLPLAVKTVLAARAQLRELSARHLALRRARLEGPGAP